MIKRTLLSCISMLAVVAGCLIPLAPATGVATDEADAGDQFGANVLTHGDLALVTPFLHEREDHNVFLFRRVAGAWQREAQFVQRSQMSSAGGLKAGALAENTVALGFPFVSSASTRFAGLVEVHRREGTDWSLSATLQPTTPSDGMRFGTAVAMDGDWLAIGAPGEPGAGNSQDPGRVFVYRWQSGAYTLVQTLVPADGAPRDRFGMRLDFTGGQLLVTAVRHVALPAADPGAVYVYTLQDQAWSLAQKLATGSGFGVAIDGDLLLTSRRVANTLELLSFRRQQGVWEIAAAGPRLPYAVPFVSFALLEGQPTRMAVLLQPGWSFTTEIYIAEFSGGVWSAPVFVASISADGDGSYWNQALALTVDQVFAGAQEFSPGSLPSRGLVRAFPLGAQGGAAPEALSHGGEQLGDRFGNALAVDGGWMIAGADGRDRLAGGRIERDAGQALLLKRGPQGWAHHQTLDAPALPVRGAMYGTQVDLRGDLAVILSPAFSTATSFLGRIEAYRRDGEQWNRLCEAIPADPGLSSLPPYSRVRTDGEHIVAATRGKLYVWRATATGCEWQGVIAEPGFEQLSQVAFSNIVGGRLLARLPAQQVGGQSLGAWAVLDFDGQAWSRTATISGTCMGEAPVLRSRTRAAFPCAVDGALPGSTVVAQVYEQQDGHWNRIASVSVSERNRWGVGDLAWDGEDLLVALRGGPLREVRVFAAPDYASAGSLAAEAEGCFGVSATRLVAGSGQVVLGCPEHNGADERRSGRLQVFDRVPAAPGSVAYAARESIELPRNPAIHADGFE